MIKKLIALLLMMTVIFNLAACSSKKVNRYEATFLELFDTVTTIIGYTKDEDEFSDYAQIIYDNLKEYHELYDIYHDYEGINNIKTINDNAGIEPVQVDQKIIDLLKYSLEAYEISQGKINIAFGAVLSIWHDYRTEGRDDPEIAKLPPMEILTQKAQHTDIHKLIIDEEASTVYLEDPEMRLDVGAIAKGYATEMVARIAYEAGFTSGSLSVGGNVRTIGVKADSNKSWNVGIQNPDLDSAEEYLYILSLKDLSLVTSGIYERFYVVDGQQYHHIIDPETLMPAQYFTSVSIVTEHSGLADGLSTTLFNMPYEQGLELVNSLPNTEALWVFYDGNMKYSEGFENYISK